MRRPLKPWQVRGSQAGAEQSCQGGGSTLKALKAAGVLRPIPQLILPHFAPSPPGMPQIETRSAGVVGSLSEGQPPGRVELPTFSLRMRRTTTMLRGLVCAGCGQGSLVPYYSASPVYGWCASDCVGIALAVPLPPPPPVPSLHPSLPPRVGCWGSLGGCMSLLFYGGIGGPCCCTAPLGPLFVGVV